MLTQTLSMSPFCKLQTKYNTTLMFSTNQQTSRSALSVDLFISKQKRQISDVTRTHQSLWQHRQKENANFIEEKKNCPSVRLFVCCMWTLYLEKIWSWVVCVFIFISRESAPLTLKHSTCSCSCLQFPAPCCFHHQLFSDAPFRLRLGTAMNLNLNLHLSALMRASWWNVSPHPPRPHTHLF